MQRFNLRHMLDFFSSAGAYGDNVQPFPPRLMLAGILLIIFFLSVFTLWSALAPIESAVVSHGIVSVESHRKQIQHLEGGIVESIHVEDGDRVTKGQLLVQLSDIQPATELRQLEMQFIEAQAALARLEAELANADEITFPEELRAREQEPSISAVLSGQYNILHTRRRLVRDQQSGISHKVAQAEEEIGGLKGQISAKKRQHQLMVEELETANEALAKQLIPKAQVLKLRQGIAQVESELSAHQAEIARLEQRVLALEIEKSETIAERVVSITDQIGKQQSRLYDLSQNIVAAQDVLQRTDIISPIDGIVVNLQIHTTDGVIAAGQPILEVVPTEDDLVIYAYIHPDDIDEVTAGMNADVRLTSASRRSRVPLEGVVTDLSADRLTDRGTGRDYYRAQIELVADTDELARSNLIAGMGAEVFIRTGARTPLDYLLSPITRNLQYGLREY